ncbi:MAG: ABC transporter permease [Rhodospirillaceae bacterium]|nr:ABC transporter permease [Rhodospirillaceae bacterium]
MAIPPSLTSAKLPNPDTILEPSPVRLLSSRAFGHSGLMVGGGILLIMVLMAIFAPMIAPFDPYDQDLAQRLIPPVWQDNGSWAHPLGTDNLGRDYISRIIYGARISLFIGFSAMLISGILGTALGVAAGYFGGRVDMVITFIITTRLALPVILVALAVVALVGSSLQIVIWVLGLLIWDRFAVVMRSATQQVRTMDYVTSARALGCSTMRIVLSEILPNIANALIVVATLEVAHAVLLEAALSFLGLGVQPPEPSWGLMVAEGKSHMLFKPWVIAIPGTAIFLLVLAINLLGDGLRDVTAPENRN